VKACTDSEVTRIARIAHEANRAVQAADGDDMPSLPWMWEPRSLRASTIAGVRRILAGITPEQNHGMWCAYKRAQGWSYGPEKDGELRLHPCLVPWEDLPARERAKARLFCAVVQALASEEELP
jgi:RyR domain